MVLVTGCGINSTKTAQTQAQQLSLPAASSTQSSSQPSTQAATQTQVQLASVPNFAQWVDLKDDKVGPNGLTPDGKPDGHIHMALHFPEPAKIKYIIIKYLGFGEHIQWEWVYNTSLNAVGAPLGVFFNSTLVQSGADVGLEVPVNCELDVYIPELNNENELGTFQFEKGQTINIQVMAVTSSGKNISKETSVPINM